MPLARRLALGSLLAISSTLVGCAAEQEVATADEDLTDGPPALIVATAMTGPGLIEAYNETINGSNTNTTVTHIRRADPVYIEVKNFPAAGWFKLKVKSRNPRADFSDAYKFAPTGFLKDAGAAWRDYANQGQLFNVYKELGVETPPDPRRGAKHVAALFLNDEDMEIFGVTPGADIEIGVFDHAGKLVKSLDTKIGLDPHKIPGATLKLKGGEVQAYNRCVDYRREVEVRDRELGSFIERTTTTTETEVVRTGSLTLENDSVIVPAVATDGFHNIIATYSYDTKPPVLDTSAIKVQKSAGGYTLTFDHATEPSALLDVTNLLTEKSYGPIEQKEIGKIDVGETSSGDILVFRISDRVRLDENGRKFANYYTIRAVVTDEGLNFPLQPKDLPNVSEPVMPAPLKDRNNTWATTLGGTIPCAFCPHRLESIEYHRFEYALNMFENHPPRCAK